MNTVNVLVGLVSFLSGVLITAIAVVLIMRSKMIVHRKSRYGFEDTVSRVERAIEKAGWVLAGSKRFNESLAKHGVNFAPRIQLISLCRAEYAEGVLRGSRHMACLMPCTFAVYEADDGSVRISKMNTGLMGRVFGGTVARIMGGKVGPEETRILQDIVN